MRNGIILNKMFVRLADYDDQHNMPYDQFVKDVAREVMDLMGKEIEETDRLSFSELPPIVAHVGMVESMKNIKPRDVIGMPDIPKPLILGPTHPGKKVTKKKVIKKKVIKKITQSMPVANEQ